VTDLDPSLLRELQADPTDPEAVWEELLHRGWSDGLPVIPPTPERVLRMLGGRDPDEVFVRLGPEQREATLARIAANAVMAGCKPEYLPAVLAALSVAGANGGMAFANSPAAPMLVFNGAIRGELDVNCSYEMLSMTSRANATIGRALRLVLANVAGAKVGRLFDVQHGMPGRLSMVFGELEEESPWEPHSVSAAGLAPGQSAVTVFLATGSMPVNYHQVPQRSSELLLILTRCLDYVRGNRIGPSPDTGGPVVVLSPKHARAFSKDGWTKERLAAELTEAVNQHWDIELEAHREKIELINRGLDPDDPRMGQPKPEGPVQVLVAGGPAGWHSLIVPTLAWGAPVTVPIP
jgi:hypothetical protein